MRRLQCVLLGHDWVSFSGPVNIPFLPWVERLVKRVCARCERTEYAVESFT